MFNIFFLLGAFSFVFWLCLFLKDKLFFGFWFYVSVFTFHVSAKKTLNQGLKEYFIQFHSSFNLVGVP